MERITVSFWGMHGVPAIEGLLCGLDGGAFWGILWGLQWGVCRDYYRFGGDGSLGSK